MKDTRPQVPLMIAPNTAQLNPNLQFYVNVLRLDFFYEVQSDSQVPNIYDRARAKTGSSGASSAFVEVRIVSGNV